MVEARRKELDKIETNEWAKESIFTEHRQTNRKGPTVRIYVYVYV